MKKLFLLLLCLTLTGCKSADDAMTRGLELRNALCNASSCSFDAVITADYGTQTYCFTVGCTFDSLANLRFEVQTPDTISGIHGRVDAEGGKLEFEDTALSFPLLADGLLSPVSAPWILMKTLRGGFITSAGDMGGKIRLIIDDSYESDSMTLHIFLDEQNIPLEADIYWQGRRILSLVISNFQML